MGQTIVSVALGDLHTLLLTINGEILSCGNGADGKLGHGIDNDELVPRVVQHLVGRQVVEIAAGDHHTIALCANGNVYFFGYAAGHGKPQTQLAPKLIRCRLSCRHPTTCS